MSNPRGTMVIETAADLPVTLDGEEVTIASGEAHIGAVGGHTTTARVTITRPADTNAYAIGDAWSDSTATPTVPVIIAGRGVGGTGVLMTLTAICSAKQTALPQFTVYVLDAAFTALEDNQPVDLSDAEAVRMVAVFEIGNSDWKPTNAASGASGNIVAQVATVYAVAFECVGTSQELYVVVQLANAYTPTSGEQLTLVFGVQQD